MQLTELDTALEILEKREAGAISLASYAESVLEVAPAAHHVLICEHIDRLLDDEWDELIINTPPGAAKSTYTSHALPAYFMGRFPTKNVILATHTAELSERWSRKVRNSVACPDHTNIFPASELSKDSTAVSRWATSKGGEVLAAGVGGSILGFRADLGILDDPISGFEQAQSESQLAKIQGWYETDFVTRLKPGAKVVLICQRLSPNDMAGYLMARNAISGTRRQKVLILRMESEGADVDPLGRGVGERLWPEWYTPEMVADAKRDEYKWLTLYQQRPPSEEGSWVSLPEIQRIEVIPKGRELTNYTLTDLAVSVNKGDFTVHLVVGVDYDHNIYIRDAVRKRTSTDEVARDHINLCRTYKPIECLIDDDNMAKVYAHLLGTEAKLANVHVPYKMLPMRGQDKETRAAPLRGLFKRRKVFMVVAPWNEWLVREILAFPNAMGAGVDDGIDALSLIGRRLLQLQAPRAPITRPTVVRAMPSLNEMYELPENRRTLGARI